MGFFKQGCFTLFAIIFCRLTVAAEYSAQEGSYVLVPPFVQGEPSASKEPSAKKEPSAIEEPSASKEPSAKKEPSASKEPSTIEQLSPLNEGTVSGVLPALDASSRSSEGSGVLHGTRNYIGSYYLSMSDSIDDFLAGSFRQTEKNESTLALFTSSTWSETGHSQADVKLKVNIDLPNTEGRYRLFLESDPREANRVDGRTRSVTQGKEVTTEDSVVGLEFSKPRELNRWKSSLSVGGRFSGGIRPLVRARARKYWQVTEKWRGYFRQDFWYLDGVGWGETSRAELTRPMTENVTFRWIAEFEYRDEASPLAYANSYQLYQRINADYEMVYRFGFLGEGTERHMSDNVFVNSTLKYRLYQNWVFVEFTPEAYFADEVDYESALSFTATLKLWFTD